MKKNWIALLLAAMMVLSLLAGCGAGSAASSAEPAASAASAETEQAAGTETEPSTRMTCITARTRIRSSPSA